jgi:hypothetical protein
MSDSIDVRTTIYDTILDHIGNTPMVRLNKIPKEYGLECELGMLKKLNFINNKKSPNASSLMQVEVLRTVLESK